ncbi:MAG: AraC family transcriptional regulator [Brevundimonas sp.]|uniref:AraC family transcriptional regulator n=1 Tax=Brevundimonas sp. TaxID=1871086 RepID=UPI0027184771|nr:AraC family transcriptional regulator [Brevundimonas sp.]MDO9607045.1 AraC family transcriptional regulator [Brevundimonas sp.]
MTFLPEMGAIIARHAPPDLSPSAVPGLRLYRSDVATRMVSVAYEPMFCLVVSGSKQTVLGDVVYTYQTGECMVVSAELPVCGSVLEPPYLAVSIDLNPTTIAAMMLETDAVAPPDQPPPSGIHIAPLDEDMVDPLTRMLRLLDRPDEIAVMTPMIERELIWRLLNSPYAATVRQIGSTESRLSGVSRAIRWIRANYATQVRVEDLSDMAGMSLSTFHRHFRTVTTMSPLQFHKQVRLQEARARLLSGGEGAAEAGFAVGYDSPSQFSREYTRRFGLPPARDAARLRETLTVG